MTDEQFARLMVALREQTAVLYEQRVLLKEMRDALVPPADLAPGDDVGCAHPEDRRLSLATFTDPQHWMCRECRFEHRGTVT